MAARPGVTWRQEAPEELWIGYRDQPNKILLKDPPLFKRRAREASPIIPAVMPRVIPIPSSKLFRRFYASIADANAPPDYPQFADGLRQMTILAAETGKAAAAMPGWMWRGRKLAIPKLIMGGP